MRHFLPHVARASHMMGAADIRHLVRCRPLSLHCFCHLCRWVDVRPCVCVDAGLLRCRLACLSFTSCVLAAPSADTENGCWCCCLVLVVLADFPYICMETDFFFSFSVFFPFFISLKKFSNVFFLLYSLFYFVKKYGSVFLSFPFVPSLPFVNNMETSFLLFFSCFFFPSLKKIWKSVYLLFFSFFK